MLHKAKITALPTLAIVVLTTYIGLAVGPTIEWSTTEIVRTIIPGVDALETVRLTPSSDLTNVDIVVVPALAPFVTISPSHFQAVKAGSSVPLILKIAFPTTTTTPSRYEGVVQVRSGKSVLPKPLPVGLGVDVVSTRPPDPATLIKDGYTNFPVNEAVVMLRDGTSISDAQAFAASVGATVIGAIPQVSIFQLATPTATVDGLTSYIRTLRARVEVDAVMRNTIVAHAASDLDHLHDDFPALNKTIAFDKVRTREAFELLRRASYPTGLPRPVSVGLVDTGLQKEIVSGTLETGIRIVPHPEFVNVDLGSSCSTLSSCRDSQPSGHGTQVAGIVGANNLAETRHLYFSPYERDTVGPSRG